MPLPADEILELEFAMMEAGDFRMTHGARVFLADLRLDDPGYDGAQLEREYRRS